MRICVLTSAIVILVLASKAGLGIEVRPLVEGDEVRRRLQNGRIMQLYVAYTGCAKSFTCNLQVVTPISGSSSSYSVERGSSVELFCAVNSTVEVESGKDIMEMRPETEAR